MICDCDVLTVPGCDIRLELLNRRRWRTRLELSTALFEYLEILHNRQRRHSALGMLNPVEYELRTPPVA
ncbi:IS3 family transposase [Streptomyces sp. NPDC096013]|uniref:IS3 family transposase n=1 Tax=Streptomyces sp. NPDC096013 TaxID=3366069 RepID=UPI0038250A8D